jgi:hypothetical protein
MSLPPPVPTAQEFDAALEAFVAEHHPDVKACAHCRAYGDASFSVIMAMIEKFPTVMMLARSPVGTEILMALKLSSMLGARAQLLASKRAAEVAEIERLAGLMSGLEAAS